MKKWIGPAWLLASIFSTCSIMAQSEPAPGPATSPWEPSTISVYLDFQSGLSDSLKQTLSNPLERQKIENELVKEMQPRIQEMLDGDNKNVRARWEFIGDPDEENAKLIISVPEGSTQRKLPTVIGGELQEPIPNELAKAFVTQLQTVLRKIEISPSEQSLNERRQVLTDKVKVLSSQRQAIRLEMETLKTALRDKGVVNEDRRMVDQKLQSQEQEIQIEIAAKTARREALEQTLAGLSDTGEAKVKNDPIAAEMQKLIDVDEQKLKLDQQRAAAGLDSSGQTTVVADEAELSNAKIRLLERREAVVHGEYGDKLPDLRAQVVTLRVDLAEARGRLEAVKDLLAEAIKVQQLLSAASEKENKLHDLDRDIDAASQELNSLQGVHAAATCTLRVNRITIP